MLYFFAPQHLLYSPNSKVRTYIFNNQDGKILECPGIVVFGSLKSIGLESICTPKELKGLILRKKERR